MKKIALVIATLVFTLFSSAVFAQINPIISFVSNRSGTYEFYTMNPDGSNVQKISTGTGGQVEPKFSKDGTKIVTTKTISGQKDIFIMNADGTDYKQLTNNSLIKDTPVLSPDNSKIAFGAGTSGGNREIYVINADGSNLVKLTSNALYACQEPQWSPDGTKLLYSRIPHPSGTDPAYKIYIMYSDGSDQRPVTNNTMHQGQPNWSPDGTKIVFGSDFDGNYEIYKMNADGTNFVRLTNNLSEDWNPAFSPDGTQISFVSKRDGNYEVYVMNADGTNQHNVTNNSAFESFNFWTVNNLPNTGGTPDVKMVSIPGGTFSMGQAFTPEPSFNISLPVHNVTLSAFEMSVYEITQGQYKSVIGSNPSTFTGDDNRPVEHVSWWDAIKFCNVLSTKAGLQSCYNVNSGICDFSKNGFRLPTEAEWEYACRAGSKTTYSLGDAESDMARSGWYYYNSSNKTHPVGQRRLTHGDCMTCTEMCGSGAMTGTQTTLQATRPTRQVCKVALIVCSAVAVGATMPSSAGQLSAATSRRVP